MSPNLKWKKHTKQDFATHKEPIHDSEISRLN